MQLSSLKTQPHMKSGSKPSAKAPAHTLRSHGFRGNADAAPPWIRPMAAVQSTFSSHPDCPLLLSISPRELPKVMLLRDECIDDLWAP